MIITRTPLRISIGGGGTDLPSYYRRFGGALISSAIDKYIFIGINKSFSYDYQIKYSKFERVAAVNDIRHPVLREALRLHHMPPALEIISMADIPAGTGLASSCTFAVRLLRAPSSLQPRLVSSVHDERRACLLLTA